MQSVIAALWPDAEGDQARTSFDTTLHRLRKMLGSDEVLVLEQGRLTLDPARCWTDVRALEQLEASMNGQPHLEAQALLDLYRGPFLASEDEASWLLATRERARSRFVRMADRLGETLVGAGEVDAAIDLLRRGIEIEPLEEALYRQLMRVQLSRGRHAEAVATYRRCRQMLSVVLGTAPSGETERLGQSIGVAG